MLAAVGLGLGGRIAEEELAGLRPMPEVVHRLVTFVSGAPVGGI
jgi:hypothetical protein